MTNQSRTPPRPALHSLQYGAEFLGVSFQLLRKWRALGKIKTIKLGRLTRISQDELNRISHEGVE